MKIGGIDIFFKIDKNIYITLRIYEKYDEAMKQLTEELGCRK